MKKRIRAFFVKPKKKLAMIMPELQQLRETHEQTSKSNDPLTAIVYFFDAVSKWYDREGVYDIIKTFSSVNYNHRYDHILDNLRTLQAHFINAGRDEYGWNRTSKGQTVTEDDVFLGNIYGLWTFPVSHWKKAKNDRKGGWGFSGMENLSVYDVISQQAKNFITSHARPMIQAINYLEMHVIS